MGKEQGHDTVARVLRHSTRTAESMQSGSIGTQGGDTLAGTYLNLAMPARIKSPAKPAPRNSPPSFAQSAMQLVSPPPPPPMPLRLSGKSPDTAPASPAVTEAATSPPPLPPPCVPPRLPLIHGSI